jgi:hypothetical protein
MWFPIILCFALGEFAFLQLYGVRFLPSYYEIPTTTLLVAHFISQSFVSVAIAAKYYGKKQR